MMIATELIAKTKLVESESQNFLTCPLKVVQVEC